MELVHYDYDRAIKRDFSSEECHRINEILNELKDIFQAESVALSAELVYDFDSMVNWKIDITRCPNIGHRYASIWTK